ncbi:MAG: chaperone modulator CbpM [Hyphomicrobiaceae bacterium]
MGASASEDQTTEIVTIGPSCTLSELCVSCKVDADWVATLVEYGVIEPTGRQPSEWQFSSLAVVRIARARRLERDLSLNPPGIALALELLDEIEELRARLRFHEKAG